MTGRRDDLDAGAGLTDDALRSMLDARASRVTAADSREVLASARLEIAGPSAGDRGGLSFAARPVSVVRRRSGVPWRLAALATAAVVAVAVLGTAVSPGRQGGDPGGTGSGAASSAPAATSSGDPGGFGVAQVGTMPAAVDVESLARWLPTGRLDGQVLIVVGRLEVQPWPCPSGAGASCFGLHLVGMEASDISSHGELTPDIVGAHGGADGPIALRVHGTNLELLGWVVGGYPEPLAMTDVANVPGPGIGELLVYRGYLEGGLGRVAACADSSRPCPFGSARLVDDVPSAGARAFVGLDVGVDPSIGLGDWPEWQVGTYLVAASNQTMRAVVIDPPRRVVAKLEVPDAAAPVSTPLPVIAGTTIATGDVQAEAWAGRLAGKHVVATGRLRVVEGCREESGLPCYRLALPGTDEIPVGLGDRSTESLDTAIAAHPDDAPMILRGDEGSLSFVGWLAGGSLEPVSLDRLGEDNAWLADGEVAIVDAALGRPHWGVACAADGMPGASCEPAGDWPYRLAPMIDWVSGPTGVTVDVSAVLRHTSDLTFGPYVVTRSAPGSPNPYLVLGRADVEHLVLAADQAQPVPTPSPAPIGTTPAPSAPPGIEQAVTVTPIELATAVEDGSLDGRIVQVTGIARLTGDCGYGTEGCSRFALDGAPGLALTWDGPLVNLGVDATTIQYDTVSGTLLLQPRDGTLRLLGRFTGDVDRPGSIADVFYRRGPLNLDPFNLEAVNGVLTQVDRQEGSCPPETDPYAMYACAVASAVLSDQPAVDGSLPATAPQIDVDIAPAAGIGDVGTSLSGPFLGRSVARATDCTYDADTQRTTCAGTERRWTIQARYDLGSVLRLDLP
jgi:hypothetical protein